MKMSLAAAGLAIAGVLGMNNNQPMTRTAQKDSVNQSQNVKGGNHQQTPVKEQARKQYRQNIHTAGISSMPFNYGVPPKQWGQYLQRTGRQKWSKKA